MSPSMDILISSNLERLLYLLFGSQRCASLMNDLKESGRYSITEDELKVLNESFVGYYTEETQCQETVKRTLEKENRLIDTHTAIAVSAAERYMFDTEAKSAMLIVSTASAYKFASDVLLSIRGQKPQNDLDAPKMLSEATGTEIPKPLIDALSKETVHTDVFDKGKDNMAQAVISFAIN